MLSQSAASALLAVFWPLYILALAAGAYSAVALKRWCIARTVIALALGSAAMQAIVMTNGGVALEWWQHFAIDLGVLWLVTMPPRHYWQAMIGALIFAQLILRGVQAMAPSLEGFVWDACMLLGYGKCFVLMLWAGGARVEAILGRASRLAARLVPASLKGSVA